MGADQAAALSSAIAAKKLIPLRALSGAFPVDSDEALLAYAESYSAVSFLLDRYGRGRVNMLLRTFRDGVTYDDGLSRALGENQAALDREWRAWLEPWPLMKAEPFEGPPPPPPPTIGDIVDGWLRSLTGAAEGRGR